MSTNLTQVVFDLQFIFIWFIHSLSTNVNHSMMSILVVSIMQAYIEIYIYIKAMILDCMVITNHNDTVVHCNEWMMRVSLSARVQSQRQCEYGHFGPVLLLEVKSYSGQLYVFKIRFTTWKSKSCVHVYVCNKK